MYWIFIVARDSVVEQSTVFEDYFKGEAYANDFIKSVNSNITDFPNYRQGMYYREESLTIGLYKNSK